LARQILQVNFVWDGKLEEAMEAFAPMAQKIADEPGLKWKVWSWNDEADEFAGEYLFADMSAVNGYLGGPIVEALKSHPKIGNLSAKVFRVLEDASKLTRGPI
jgi:hypothetical protein